MSFLEEIPNDLLNLVVLELDYPSFYNLIKSNMINEMVVDYKYLFYNMDEMLIGQQMTVTSDTKINKNEISEDDMPELKFCPIEMVYTGYSSIIKDDRIIKTYIQHTNYYKILYIMQIKRDIYLSHLNDWKRIYKLDKNLYELLIINKNHLYDYNFKCLDDVVTIYYQNDLSTILETEPKDNGRLVGRYLIYDYK